MKAQIVDWTRERRVSKPHAKLKRTGPLVRGLFVPSNALLMAPAGPRNSPTFHLVQGYDPTQTRKELTFQPCDTTGFLPVGGFWEWEDVKVSAQEVRSIVRSLRRGEKIDKKSYEDLLFTLRIAGVPEEPEDVPF